MKGGNNHLLAILQIRKHLPSNLRDLLDTGKFRITITDLRQGSVVVDFTIEMVTDQNTTNTEVEDAVTEALKKSTALKVDPNSTSVQGMFFSYGTIVSLCVAQSVQVYQGHSAFFACLIADLWTHRAL